MRSSRTEQPIQRWIERARKSGSGPKVSEVSSVGGTSLFLRWDPLEIYDPQGSSISSGARHEDDMALKDTIESVASRNDAQAAILAFEQQKLPLNSDAHRAFGNAIEQHRLFADALREILEPNADELAPSN